MYSGESEGDRMLSVVKTGSDASRPVRLVERRFSDEAVMHQLSSHGSESARCFKVRISIKKVAQRRNKAIFSLSRKRCVL